MTRAWPVTSPFRAESLRASTTRAVLTPGIPAAFWPEVTAGRLIPVCFTDQMYASWDQPLDDLLFDLELWAGRQSRVSSFERHGGDVQWPGFTPPAARSMSAFGLAWDGVTAADEHQHRRRPGSGKTHRPLPGRPRRWPGQLAGSISTFLQPRTPPCRRRYAALLADGHGIALDIGEPPVDGATDFLFMLSVAAMTRLGSRSKPRRRR